MRETGVVLRRTLNVYFVVGKEGLRKHFAQGSDNKECEI